MRLQFVGCGDAFGSGGRFNTCFHVTGTHVNFLIDCGATSLVAMKQLGIALNDIQTILITHFHADHFGGLPPFVLDAQFFSKRKAPLTIIGPHELNLSFVRAMETAFPGSSQTKPKFPLQLLELAEHQSVEINNLHVTPHLVKHGQTGGPFFAYRIESEGRVLAYTGDTEWTDSLIDVGKDADLFIAEAYFREKRVPLHLDLATLEAHLPDIRPRRLILTHMSNDMLIRQDTIEHQCAQDGMIIEV